MKEAADALLGRDPDTGMVDTDRVLEAVSWLSRAVFSHAKTDRPHQDKAGLLAQVQATQAVMNTVSAVQHVRVAQYAATAESLDPDPGVDEVREHAHELGHVCEFTDVDLSPAMCWGPMQAPRRIEEAVDAVTKTPRLLDEMGAGRLDAARVAHVTWELVEAGDTTCAHVEDLLLERGLTEWTAPASPQPGPHPGPPLRPRRSQTDPHQTHHRPDRRLYPAWAGERAHRMDRDPTHQGRATRVPHRRRTRPPTASRYDHRQDVG